MWKTFWPKSILPGYKIIKENQTFLARSHSSIWNQPGDMQQKLTWNDFEQRRTYRAGAGVDVPGYVRNDIITRNLQYKTEQKRLKNTITRCSTAVAEHQNANDYDCVCFVGHGSFLETPRTESTKTKRQLYSGKYVFLLSFVRCPDYVFSILDMLCSFFDSFYSLFHNSVRLKACGEFLLWSPVDLADYIPSRSNMA